MLVLLVWLPPATSLILGTIYVLFGAARAAAKLLVTLVFCTAVYLQFFSLHSLAGLLLQIGLALYLALWRRLDTFRL